MTTLPADLERVLAQADKCMFSGNGESLLATWLRNNTDALCSALADAERYRLLKSWLPNPSAEGSKVQIHFSLDCVETRESLDSAIDAARAQEAGQ